MIAFARQNNLFLVKLLFNSSESQVTTDGKFGEIINGLPDWVYEEEFATSRSFEFSADSKVLAYIRYDESKVMNYDMPMYIPTAGESNHEYDDYKKPYSYKYPVAGAQNSTVSVHTFDIKNRVTRKLALPIDSTDYIPRISFTEDPEFLAIVTLNRHQNRMDIFKANPLSGLCKRILREESPEYINETTYQDLTFFKNHFVMQSERDGNNHLYLYTIGGNLVKQLTKGAYDVNGFIGWDEKKNTFYYSSNEGNPTQSAIYKIDAKGKKTRISQREGTNSAIFSKSLKYHINTYQNLTTPPVVTINDSNGKELKTLLDNKELLDRLVKLGAKITVLTRVSLSEGKTGVMGYDRDRDEFYTYQNDKVGAMFHGTGDLFSSTAIGEIMKGRDWKDAMRIAADYTAHTIQVTLDNPKKPWYGVDFETTLADLITME
jgi:dipeptidyl-peptidase-4